MTADRDAAPATAEGADLLQAIEMLARGVKVAAAKRQHGIISPVKIPLHCARVLLAARPAPAAAPREGEPLAELIARGEAMKEAFFTGDDNREAIACIEWDAAVEAAREAARGEGETTP